MPLLHLARYRDIAAEVAERLIAGGGVEVLVASGGVANAIADELLRRGPSGFAGLRIETIETFAARVVNAAGEFPREANNAERRLAMCMAVRSVESFVLESHVRYRQPARFDDRLSIHARIGELRGARFRFDYLVMRDDDVIADGWTSHACIDATTLRPMRIPAALADSIATAESLSSSKSS